MVAERLSSNPLLTPARVISSSLGRAVETAAAIATAAGVRVTPDARLIEIGQGEWEGRTHTELAQTDAERYAAWRAATGGWRIPPGGESIDSAEARVRELLAELERPGPDDTWPVCLVSHGGTLRILARALLGIGATRTWGLDVDNAAIGVALRVDDGWQLERWNDALHLLGLEPTHVDESEGRPLAL